MYRSDSLSIKSRLRQISLISILSFAVIALTLYVTLIGVRGDIDRIVGGRLQQTLENSQNSRDFGGLQARIGVFTSTFFGDDALLAGEGAELEEMIGALYARVTDPALQSLLSRLRDQFTTFRERAEWINILLAWRSEQDRDINELLQLLQEIIAERTLEVALAGGSTDYLQQLVQLISGYRESLLEIAKLNAEERPLALFNASLDDAPPLVDKLRGLSLRMRTLTASEPPIDRFGRHLISRLEYYRYLMRLYHMETIRLGELKAELDTVNSRILAAMQQQDQQSAHAAMQIGTDIRETIYATVAIVLSLLIFHAGVFWFAHRNLFRKHIQTPMELISRRLRGFQQGDMQTPMHLQRSDEWGEVEEVFNKMIFSLQESLYALQESEKRYREIFTNATEGIFRSTLEGRFIELNPAAADMLGYQTAEDAIAELTDLGTQLYQDRDARETMLQLLYKQEKNLNFETQMRRRDGSLFWCSMNNYLIRDDSGKILYIEGTIRDISEHRAAQESVQRLQAYLQNIIDSMPSVLIGVDIETRVTLWNGRARQESFLSPEEARGKTMQQVCRLFDPDCYLPALQTTLKTRRPQRLLKVESLKDSADGGKRYFDILIYPLSLTSASGAVIHMDDVTERVRLEEMMVRSEKMRSVGSLASGLAHEINNPLASIMQNAQVLNQRLSPDLRKNRELAETLGTDIETIVAYHRQRGCEKVVQSITIAGRRAAKIVENMQSFSRRSTSGFIPCQLSELLERTLELAGSDYDMRYQFNFQKIRVVRDYREVPPVACESSQIQQALLNLLKNAAQAMHDYVDQPQLTLRVLPADAQHVLLQIVDNGPGMDAELSRKIFDPFYTTRDVGRGIGLGLPIAYFIVTHNHQGTLSIVSEPDQGTRFDMVLPVEQPADPV